MLEPDAVLQGRYRILSHIGKGGMGTVFLAKDQNLGVTVAVKQNFFDEPRLIEAFKREARLLAGLRHSVLPQVKDYFIDDTGQYLVMEYISGDDLWTTLENRRWNVAPTSEPKPLDADKVMHWAEQLLEALNYLHTRPEPVIHRDIKPQNLKVAERDQIILLDFGLAKGKPLWMTRVTTTGSLYGYTPSYAPIEQIRGVGTDPRSDLYALGATLYHLLTGLPPVDAATRADAFLGSEPDPLQPPNEVNPKVPKGIAEVLMKAMEPHRNNRPASAAETLDMLLAAKRSTVIDWQAKRERERIAEILEQEGEVWPTTQIEIKRRIDDERIVLAEADLREDQEQKEKKDAERKQREEENLKAKEEAEQKQREERERKATEEAKRKYREEQERRDREAQRLRQEQEKAERAAIEAEIRRQREETDRKQREEQDNAAKEWAEEHLHQEVAERREPEEQQKLRLVTARKLREDTAQQRQQVDRKRKEKEKTERLRLQHEQTQLEREDADRRFPQQREDAEKLPVIKEDAMVRRAVAPNALAGTEHQRDLRNKVIGTFSVVILAFSIWYLVSGSNNTGSFKPGSVSAVATPASSQATNSPIQAPALKPGPFNMPTRVIKVALSDDGRVLASVGDEAKVRLLQANGTRELLGHTQKATSVAVSHDGQIVASGCKDGTIRLWSVSDGAVIKSWNAHSDFVFSVGFSLDRNALVSAGGDGAVKLWRLSDGVLINTTIVPEKDYTIVAVSPDQGSAGFYRDDGAFKVWSLMDDHVRTTLRDGIPSVNCGALSKDGLQLAIGIGELIQLWRLVTDGRLIFQGPTTAVSVTFSPDGQTLAAGFRNGAIKLWSVQDGRALQTLESHTKAVNSLAFSADGQVLVSGSDDRSIRVWAVARNEMATTTSADGTTSRPN